MKLGIILLATSFTLCFVIWHIIKIIEENWRNNKMAKTCSECGSPDIVVTVTTMYEGMPLQDDTKKNGGKRYNYENAVNEDVQDEVYTCEECGLEHTYEELADDSDEDEESDSNESKKDSDDEDEEFEEEELF